MLYTFISKGKKTFIKMKVLKAVVLFKDIIIIIIFNKTCILLFWTGMKKVSNPYVINIIQIF